jgi:queuosine precursor transporter
MGDSRMILIALYLIAIVAANLLVAKFGIAIVMINAFVFIGLDLTMRDALHEQWDGRNLWAKMALLIGTGSLLSALLNWQVAPIALASFIAFTGAGIADSLTYHVLGAKTRLIRMNGSNVIAAVVDSFLFPAIAFGFPLLIPVMLGQFVAKVAGGFVWSLLLVQVHKQALEAVS